MKIHANIASIVLALFLCHAHVEAQTVLDSTKRKPQTNFDRNSQYDSYTQPKTKQKPIAKDQAAPPRGKSQADGRKPFNVRDWQFQNAYGIGLLGLYEDLSGETLQIYALHFTPRVDLLPLGSYGGVSVSSPINIGLPLISGSNNLFALNIPLVAEIGVGHLATKNVIFPVGVFVGGGYELSHYRSLFNRGTQGFVFWKSNFLFTTGLRVQVFGRSNTLRFSRSIGTPLEINRGFGQYSFSISTNF